MKPPKVSSGTQGKASVPCVWGSREWDCIPGFQCNDNGNTCWEGI